MAAINVLVLGNDPFINTINFDKLDPRVITLGVNRIWLKHIPDYFFFNDTPIITELNKNPGVLDQLKKQSFCFSSDWLGFKDSSVIPDWTAIYDRLYPKGIPDSVTTSIGIFSKDLSANRDVTFYIAGVSLKWQEPSHFWKTEQYDSLNRHGQDWYAPRFEAILKNFDRLKSSGIKMVSVTPNSMLNKVMRYEKIENFYV
jgi:hypothetical protein